MKLIRTVGSYAKIREKIRKIKGGKKTNRDKPLEFERSDGSGGGPWWGSPGPRVGGPRTRHRPSTVGEPVAFTSVFV